MPSCLSGGGFSDACVFDRRRQPALQVVPAWRKCFLKKQLQRSPVGSLAFSGTAKNARNDHAVGILTQLPGCKSRRGQV